MKDGAGDEQMDAYDFLEKAEMADSTAEALKYARKALSLDEYCLDADVMIAELQSKDAWDYQKKLEKVIDKGAEQLKERDISFDKYMCFKSSRYSFISSPERGAQEPFSMMAQVRFCRFSAFISSRKFFIGGKIPRL